VELVVAAGALGRHNPSIDPVSFAAMRYVIAALVLLTLTMVRHRSAGVAALRDRTTLRQVALLGVVYYAITQAAQFVAIVRQPAASTSLILSATVIVVAVLSRRSLGEAATRATLLGAAVVVIGSLIYLRGDLGFSVAGTIAALIALATALPPSSAAGSTATARSTRSSSPASP
jgi:drug/metabolite transporter (DMT)-like permease